MKNRICAFMILLPLITFVFIMVTALCVPRNIERVNVKAAEIPKEMEEKQELVISYLDEKGKVREVKLEEYLIGVVGAEMPAEYELEALKAQAVAARSYIMNKMLSDDKEHPEADVCSNPNHCKAYMSENELTDRWERKKRREYLDKIKSAVVSTKGEYMVYDGEAIEAFFFAGSGGRTENPKDVWGGERPYLKSVESPSDVYSPKLISEAALSERELREKLAAVNGKATQASDGVRIGEITRSEGGSVQSINIDGISYTGQEVRRALGLRSANFDIKTDGDNVVFNVRGSGHGVGMSQVGADYMARQGQKYTEILAHYYTNIQIVKAE